MIGIFFSIAFLVIVCVLGNLNTEAARVTDFSRKNLAPCSSYIFGTDWLGRDMLARTLKGLSMSILIGVVSAAVSAVVALVLGIAAATLGKTADSIISFVIDLIMGVPHILLLILISVALGKGLKGVVIGVALTHWPDPGGSHTAEGKSVYSDFCETWKKQVVHCQEAYAAASSAAVSRRSGAAVSPCDPP